MSYKDLWEWAASTRDLDSYFTADDLLQDLRSEFLQRGKEFPKGAEDTIRQRFDFRVPYAEMERRRQEDQLVADMLGIFLSANIFKTELKLFSSVESKSPKLYLG